MPRDKNKYKYKVNYTNGEMYLQVWKLTNDKREYYGTIGSAKKAAMLLVKVKVLEIQTKKLTEALTKILDDKNGKLDQILKQIKN